MLRQWSVYKTVQFKIARSRVYSCSLFSSKDIIFDRMSIDDASVTAKRYASSQLFSILIHAFSDYSLIIKKKKKLFSKIFIYIFLLFTFIQIKIYANTAFRYLTERVHSNLNIWTTIYKILASNSCICLFFKLLVVTV